jgi:hypothetical protein
VQGHTCEYTRVLTRTDTGIDERKLHVQGHTREYTRMLTRTEYRHQRARAACARSYMRVHASADPHGIQASTSGSCMCKVIHASERECRPARNTGIKKRKLHVQGHTREYTRVLTRTDTGIDKRKLHVQGHTHEYTRVLTRTEYRHQRAEAACAMSYTRVHASADPHGIQASESGRCMCKVTHASTREC